MPGKWCNSRFVGDGHRNNNRRRRGNLKEAARVARLVSLLEQQRRQLIVLDRSTNGLATFPSSRKRRSSRGSGGEPRASERVGRELSFELCAVWFTRRCRAYCWRKSSFSLGFIITVFQRKKAIFFIYFYTFWIVVIFILTITCNNFIERIWCQGKYDFSINQENNKLNLLGLILIKLHKGENKVFYKKN